MAPVAQAETIVEPGIEQRVEPLPLAAAAVVEPVQAAEAMVEPPRFSDDAPLAFATPDAAPPSATPIDMPPADAAFSAMPSAADAAFPATPAADLEQTPFASTAASSGYTADAADAENAGIRLAQVKEELVAWVKTLVSAAVYAVLIVTFVFQVARVEGQSMAPTLEDQDRLIVNKLAYRMGEPRRGDIVMLYYPLNPEKSFVKRVIAEEGDTVRIVDGRVYVNDIPLSDDYVLAKYRSHDDWGPQVIPEGYDFVMGDHRNNSSDSRHWGMVPKRYIIGRVQLRWWPVPTARIF